LIKWRNSRVAWREYSGSAPTSVDDVLVIQLELVTSKKHNDLILRRVASDSPAKVEAAGVTREGRTSKASVVNNPEPAECFLTDTLETAVDHMSELDFLRAENAKLRRQNEELLLADGTSGTSIPDTAARCEKTQRWADIFDDPYEPPPEQTAFGKFQLPCMSAISSPSCGGSTAASSDWSSEPSLSSCGTPMSMQSGMPCFSFHSGYATPLPMTPGPDSDVHSGVMTPALMSQACTRQQVCALVPMWFSLVGDRCVIPTGIVAQFKAKIEEGESQAIEPPSFLKA